MTTISALVLLKFSVVLAVPYRARLPMYHTSYTDYSGSSQSTYYASSRFYSSEYNPGQNQIPGSSGDYSDCCAGDDNYVGHRQIPGRDSGQDYPIEPQSEPSPFTPSAHEKTITGNGEGDYEEEVPAQDSRAGSPEDDHDERRHSAEPEEKEKDQPKVPKNASPEKKGPENSKEEDDDDDIKPQPDDDLTPKTPSSSFTRSCSSYFDCDFAPPYTNDTGKDKEYFESTWFTCNGQYCVCELFGVVQFTPFTVNWSKNSNQCLSDFGGPCGRHDGLEIHCAAGYHCMDGICDDPKKSTTEKPSSTTPACGCEGGKDCQGDQVNPFAVLFFPKNVFETVLNTTIKEITDSKSPNE